MSRLGLVLAGIFLTACSSLPLGSPATTEAPPTDALIDPIPLCTTLTLNDARAKSPFQTPLTRMVNAFSPGKCEYRSDEDAGDQVSIVVTATDYPSTKKARSALDDARQAAVDHGLPVADIDGLGDAAFSSGVDEVVVSAVAGDRLITVTLQGEWPDTTDDAKVAAGTELVRTLLSRLT